MALVLRRHFGEKVYIGKDIAVSVRPGNKGTVKIVIEAPENVRVLREELFKKELQKHGMRKSVGSGGCGSGRCGSIKSSA
ncbi:MAG: carbon storage regulator [Candidatus Thorarchaeota archaeon]